MLDSSVVTSVGGSVPTSVNWSVVSMVVTKAGQLIAAPRP